MGQAWLFLRGPAPRRPGGVNWEKSICQFRVILVGESRVGKTSLVLRLTEDKFSVSVQQTIGVDYYAHMLETPSILRVKLQVCDTAGQKELRTMTGSYLQVMLGGLLVFDITNRHSLDYIRNWLDEASDLFDQCKYVFILVGHKSDLSAERTVSTEEAEKFAEDLGLRYIETSAKDNTNIQEVFHMLAASIAEMVKPKIKGGIAETRLVIFNR
ncbi:ras-related protein Rab-39A-like [Hemitrygon akajei]|uniref:ras-related protein Rab-39A-like n=1 Tax=Hemitrygon akajei TaxID=2704970 RepID=UPI003BF9C10F